MCLLWAFALFVMIAGAQTARAQTDKTNDELKTLKEILTKPTTTAASRIQIAKILLKKGTPEANQVLVDALALSAQPGVQTAVLAAIANEHRPDPVFLKNILALLGSDNAKLRSATTSALAAYEYLPKEMDKLSSIADDAEQPLAKRLSAVEALGKTMYRPAIGTLVGLLKSESTEIRRDAASALKEITGIEDLGTDADAWAKWWKQQKRVSTEEFLRQVIRRGRRQQREDRKRAELLEHRLIELLRDVYSRLSPKEKLPLVLKHLSDNLPEVRVLAARQAADVAVHFRSQNSGKTPEEFLSSLMAHIGDTEPQVRRAVADALAITDSPKAAEELLKRLAAETDLAVKSRLARAMGLLRQPDAVPLLIKLLAEKDDELAIQAAKALGTLGEKGSATEKTAAKALKPLEKLLGPESSRSASVREAGCWAIAKIGRPESKSVLIAALADAAPPVRFSAVRGLGNLGPADNNTEQALLKHLSDENKGVRTAVADTLCRVGGPRSAEALAGRLSEEPAQDVKKAVWDAVLTLAKSAASQALAEKLSDKFLNKPGPDNHRRAAALLEVAIKKYPADGDVKHLRSLREKAVAAYTAAETPLKAVPLLRDLLAILKPDEKSLRISFTFQLGMILLNAQPHTEGVKELAAVFDELPPEKREKVLAKVFEIAQSLSSGGKQEQAHAVLDALRSVRPQWNGKEWSKKLEKLYTDNLRGIIGQSLKALQSKDEKARKGATETLRSLGDPALPLLLDELRKAAEGGKKTLETRLFEFLETQCDDVHGYDPTAAIEKKKQAIQQWRKSLLKRHEKDSAAPTDEEK
ncbi:MAG: HEAT repeat domain-containing protein [Planctomycetia bacterium]|nr:HEAT repeat domain-containing protein [Planctomycetia bacterium]